MSFHQFREATSAQRRSVVTNLHKALRQTADVLDDPEDVTFELLTLLRNPNVDKFGSLFPKASVTPEQVPVMLAGRPVLEQSALCR